VFILGAGRETNGDGAHSAQSPMLRLLGYLEHDPDNLTLIADAAHAAFDESAFDNACDLLARYRMLSSLPMPMVNLEGLVALRAGRLDVAAVAFDTLLADGVTDPAVRFNRAWVHALCKEHSAVLALLDEETVAVTPRAAALKVQALHHLGQIEEALAVGQGMAERFPGNDALLGALSVAAMDADDIDLARHYAEQAGGGVDALTTRGLIALNGDDPARALTLFDQALSEQRDAPRAWLGKGLGLVVTGKVADGTKALSRGAALFGNHLGSWIAVGWAQVISKDLEAARATFDHALSFDENFAETHGGLAVLDIAEGNLDGAKRRADIALRLDRNCFGGMLARILLHQAKGNTAAAAQIWEKAMDMPTGVGGKTLAQAIIGMGLQADRPRGGKAS
jgi:tetratricopeptide (TPR) repeat protein